MREVRRRAALETIGRGSRRKREEREGESPHADPERPRPERKSTTT
jgi:hypothetical protein